MKLFLCSGLEVLSHSQSFLGTTEKDSEDFWRGPVMGESENMLGRGFMTIQPTPLFHRKGSEDQGGMWLVQPHSMKVLSRLRVQRLRVSCPSAQLSPGMRCSHSLWVVYGMKEPERDAVKVKVTQSCPSLCNPMTIQYMEFSRPEYWSGWSEVKLLSRVRLFETPWTVAYQAPLSMGFSRQ